ncbi:MAG: metallophosphoesterase family protein [Gemmatimonadetes bacterium]|nr:metallophosphoesterase family protein [Gemmatimonadota bacterium]
MRYGILSDIHGNLEALDAVLEAMAGERIGHYLCLGDIVGYGASPNACLDRVSGLTTDVIAGNHDHAAIGKLDISSFNPYAAEAALWTRRQLTPDGRRYLGGMPYVWRNDDLFIVHASPARPEEWTYLTSPWQADEAFEAIPADLALCTLGHTHVPLIFEKRNAEDRSRQVPSSALELALDLASERSYIVNVGSVGQPRDGDPRAAYCVYDTEMKQIEIKRVAYDLETAQRKIRKAGLPDLLAERLEFGR